MGQDAHNEDKKLRNNKRKLHNSDAERSEAESDANDMANENGDTSERSSDVKDGIYYWEGPTGTAHAAPIQEGGGVLLRDLVLNDEEVYASRLDEIEKLTHELRGGSPRDVRRATAATTSPRNISDKLSTLEFTREDLEEYVAHRSEGLAPKSKDWITRASKILWDCTGGDITRATITTFRESVLGKYRSADSYSKVLSFARAYLKFLAKTRDEPDYLSFDPYLELPKAVKERKSITGRIVTKDDVSHVLRYIEDAKREGKISPERAEQYSAFVLFGACTGQRSEATTARLTVGQFREALNAEKPVLLVDATQDKIRMSHYVPIHPCVRDAIRPLLKEREAGDLMFTYISFLQWIKRQKIPMSQFKGTFVLGDLRKFSEQHGDIIGWEQSNRAYILTHGVSGVAWSHYKHPLPEHVYDIYMKYWRNVELSCHG